MENFIAVALILIGVAAVLYIVLTHPHHHPRRIATRGLFVFKGAHCMSVILNPGQSVTAAIVASDDQNNPVPITGVISFGASGPLTVVQNDDQNATYTAPSDALPGDYAVVATFENALGQTITVNDSITVAAAQGVATRGNFVFGVPA